MSQFPNDLKEFTFLYPTDTTFGLGCDAFNEKLVHKISELKERSLDKNFILLVATASQLMDLVKVPDLAWEIIDISDRPITIVYDEPTDKLPQYLLNDDGTIGIRLTDDRLCKGIIQKFKNPIISTSANISGEKVPNSFQEIDSKILDKVDYVFPECKTFVPEYPHSSIIKISDGGLVKVIRA